MGRVSLCYSRMEHGPMTTKWSQLKGKNEKLSVLTRFCQDFGLDCLVEDDAAALGASEGELTQFARSFRSWCLHRRVGEAKDATQFEIAYEPIAKNAVGPDTTELGSHQRGRELGSLRKYLKKDHAEMVRRVLFAWAWAKVALEVRRLERSTRPSSAGKNERQQQEPRTPPPGAFLFSEFPEMALDNPHLWIPSPPGWVCVRASTANERSNLNDLTWRFKFPQGNHRMQLLGVHIVQLGNPTALRPTERKAASLKHYGSQEVSTKKADEWFGGPVDYREWAANIGDPDAVVPESGLSLADHLARWHLVGGTNAEGDVGARPSELTALGKPGKIKSKTKKEAEMTSAEKLDHRVRQCPHKWPLPDREPIVLEALDESRVTWEMKVKAAEVLELLNKNGWFAVSEEQVVLGQFLQKMFRCCLVSSKGAMSCFEQ